VVVKDPKRGFDSDTIPNPSSAENLEAEHGILLMRSPMDEVRFESGGTKSTCCKDLDKRITWEAAGTLPLRRSIRIREVFVTTNDTRVAFLQAYGIPAILVHHPRLIRAMAEVSDTGTRPHAL
jgi:hypothetical protein